MRNSKIIFFLFLFLLPTTLALSEIDLYFSSDITLEREQPYSEAHAVTARVYLIPKQELGQELLSLNTIGKQGLDEITYKWDSPNTNLLEYSYKANVRTIANLKKVYSKTAHPYPKLPHEIEYFTKSSEKVDAQYETIKELAKKLKAQETDAWKIVNNIGLWVKNSIEYNLSTLTAEVSQPASWVLQKRYGVCDEITTLFIALLRSLGIPARFVQGVAEAGGLNYFGAHGWAEVYFPNQGWIPFDVTFGQFGWIDESHVKLQDTLDPSDPGVQVEWRGRFISAELGELKLNAKFLRDEEEKQPLLEYKVLPQFSNIGYESYNLITVNIKNPQSFHVTESFTLAPVNELEIISDSEQWAVMSPDQEIQINYIVKLKEGLAKHLQYIVPIVISSGRDQTEKSIFKVAPNNLVRSLNDVQNILVSLKQEELKPYSEEVDLSCNPSLELFFENDAPEINCIVSNNGGLILRDVDVCARNKCNKISVAPNDKVKINFKFLIPTAGRQDIIVTANNDLIAKSNMVAVDIYDDPVLEINEIISSEEIKSKTELIVKIIQKSHTAPVEATIITRTPKRKIITELEDGSYETDISIPVEPDDFAYGDNEVKVEVNYKTPLGEEKKIAKTTSIKKGTGGFISLLLENAKEIILRIWEIIIQ